jgi:hypothetical protein
MPSQGDRSLIRVEQIVKPSLYPAGRAIIMSAMPNSDIVA